MSETKTAVELVADIETKITELKKEAEKQSKDYGDLSAAMEAKMAAFAKDAETKSAAEIKAFQKEMQDQFDELSTKAGKVEEVGYKGISEGIVEGVNKQFEGIKFVEQVDNALTDRLRSEKSLRIELPGVKHMIMHSTKNETLAGSLTGDPVATYSTRQAIYPAQKVNFRDLIPTVNTETGLYVFYRENSGMNNNIAKQLEGSLKAENSYAFTEVKVVQQYIAGYTTFSKQMLTSLPWMQNTLPRLLMRDFFKAENSLFFTTVSQAATAVTPSGATVVPQIVNAISTQRDLNFNVSFGLVSNTEMAAIINDTFEKGYYPGAGGITMNANGIGVSINGVPILPASWVPTGKILLIDNDFLERVQAKGLAIELSYENNDNFIRNMVTARIECQEEINLMLATSAVYATIS